MILKVNIWRLPLQDGIGVAFKRESLIGNDYYNFQTKNFDHLDELIEMPESNRLELTNDMGRALLEELSNYFIGTQDYRVLRGDFEAERTRVDNLITALTTKLNERNYS